MENTILNTHSISISNRTFCEIKGIKKIESISSTKILLKTDVDYICILGTKLEILTLSTEKGDLTLEGNIDVINYQNNQETEIKAPEKKESFIKKLLK